MKKAVLGAREPELRLEDPLIIAQNSCHHQAPLITHEPHHRPPPRRRRHLAAWLTTPDKTAINDPPDIRLVITSEEASAAATAAAAASALMEADTSTRPALLFISRHSGPEPFIWYSSHHPFGFHSVCVASSSMSGTNLRVSFAIWALAVFI